MSGVGDVVVARHDQEMRSIGVELRRCWPMIGDASVKRCPSGVGTFVEVRLDPVLVRARASQQGLADPSAAAAARSPRIAAALQRSIDAVNAGLAAEDTIVGFVVVD